MSPVAVTLTETAAETADEIITTELIGGFPTLFISGFVAALIPLLIVGFVSLVFPAFVSWVKGGEKDV